jgi:hypothetical protein
VTESQVVQSKGDVVLLGQELAYMRADVARAAYDEDIIFRHSKKSPLHRRENKINVLHDNV